jgi:anti-sigma regulatory factor (Ser/Thr protein kinase)
VTSWTLAPGPDAPRKARQLLRPCLDAADVHSEDVELLVSELVANVVRHAGTTAALRFSDTGDRIRVEVEDGSSHPPVPVAEPGVNGGYGLRIVAALADSWGIELTDAGKVVWFEVAHRHER